MRYLEGNGTIEQQRELFEGALGRLFDPRRLCGLNFVEIKFENNRKGRLDAEFNGKGNEGGGIPSHCPQFGKKPANGFC